MISNTVYKGNMKRYWVAALLLASVIFTTFGQEAIDISILFEDGNPWGQKASLFMRNINQPNAVRSFDWISSDARNEARYPKWKNSPEVELWGFKVWESLAKFDDGELSRIKVSLYNKGDVEAKGGPESLIRGQDKIVILLRDVDAKLVKWSGAKGRDIRDSLPLSKGATVRGRHFLKNSETLVGMVWSYSGKSRSNFLLEYFTLTFEPLTKDNDPRIPRMRQRSTVRDTHRPTAKNLVSHVTRSVHDDVFIDGFPMVDQGAKGYCAVATLERILRYYGQEADQHVLAQLAESSGRGGTSHSALSDALKKSGVKLGVTVRELQGLGTDIREWERMVKDYNRQAKKEKKPKIRDSQWITRSGRSMTYNFGKLFDAFDWEVYTNYKLKKKQYDLKKFRKYIKDNIDKGVPLVWSVMLGKVPEPQLPQIAGGHMRTIIGYNLKNDEVIYTDSWGPGHEFKKMKSPEAFTITMQLNLVAPRLRR